MKIISLLPGVLLAGACGYNSVLIISNLRIRTITVLFRTRNLHCFSNYPFRVGEAGSKRGPWRWRRRRNLRLQGRSTSNSASPSFCEMVRLRLRRPYGRKFDVGCLAKWWRCRCVKPPCNVTLPFRKSWSKDTTPYLRHTRDRLLKSFQIVSPQTLRRWELGAQIVRVGLEII